MEQGLVPSSWMNRRLSVLEQDQARRAAYEEPNYQWNFNVAPTCPSSTTVHIRGGQVWGDPDTTSGYQWYVEDLTCDIADSDTTDYSYTFANANYYKPLALHIRYSGSPEYLVVPGRFWFRILEGSEYETAAEAENEAYPQWPDGAFLSDAGLGLPLCIIIVRNNGNTAEENQFMPVDRANRGQSYLWQTFHLRYQW